MLMMIHLVWDLLHDQFRNEGLSISTIHPETRRYFLENDLEKNSYYGSSPQAALRTVRGYKCVFRRSRSLFRDDADEHSREMAITIGAKRRWQFA